MTGRAAGYCAGYPVPGFMNPYGGRGFAGWGLSGYAPGPAAPYAGAFAGAPYGAPYAAGLAPYGYGAAPYGSLYGSGGARPYRGFGRFGGGFGFGRGFGLGRGLGRGRGFGGGRGFRRFGW